jgi:hypothetical protein
MQANGAVPFQAAGTACKAIDSIKAQYPALLSDISDGQNPNDDSILADPARRGAARCSAPPLREGLAEPPNVPPCTSLAVSPIEPQTVADSHLHDWLPWLQDRRRHNQAPIPSLSASGSRQKCANLVGRSRDNERPKGIFGAAPVPRSFVGRYPLERPFAHAERAGKCRLLRAASRMGQGSRGLAASGRARASWYGLASWTTTT